jgi:hypothetical protein
MTLRGNRPKAEAITRPRCKHAVRQTSNRLSRIALAFLLCLGVRQNQPHWWHRITAAFASVLR